MKQIKHTSVKITWFLIASVLCGGLARLAPAATYYWDNTTPIEANGFGTAGGTWGTDAKWSTSNTGTANSGISTTAVGDTVNFGTATAGLTTGTVAVNGTVNVGNISVGSASGAITIGSSISSGTNSLGTGGGSISNNSSSSLTINTDVFIVSGSPSYRTISAGHVILNGSTLNSGYLAVKKGATLTLNNSGSVVGLQAGGTITIGADNLTWGNLNSGNAGDTANYTGGTLDLNGHNFTIGNMQWPSGTVTDNSVGSGTTTLTTIGSNTSNFSGTIADGTNKKVAFIYNGGSLYLTLVVANTFSGNTKVQNNRLVLGNNLAIQSSAIDSSGAGKFVLGTGITTPTIGGLTGSKNLSSVFDATYTNLTALTLNPGTGQTNTYSGSITNGASGMTLTKTGAGVQILTGTNFYTGSTSVNAGVLVIGATYALPSGTNVNINATGKLQLDVNASTYRLYLDGKLTTKGVWGSPTSGAQHTSDYFLGSGKLTVVNGLPNGTFIRFF